MPVKGIFSPSKRIKYFARQEDEESEKWKVKSKVRFARRF